ncbi:DUF1853 family protein [Flavivirga algicola]|uniref:DUF1853 family protein n=1 Tax=Flavivirga algicola TaxID=2729136 RepID=A0ABX1RXY3_9FLAO|nr:DUF1853 family protein [Flavivirga algicola]NMH87049.1 DUF1853 family protein [Flavivirga algicola]
MLQKRYKGFLKTPCLWHNDAILKLEQFEVNSIFNKININIDEKLRLGKYVERLVSFQLNQHKNISILAENVQIQHHKVTLGELDCLLLKNNKPIHLEIIYKFYLYDPLVGETEIEYFIGPNRKDSLKDKISKLKDKQLPLLHSNECKHYLKSLSIKTADISQQVYFKAQLFLPYANQDIHLKTLNNACVVGFYITKNELRKFTNCKFYIPKKKDWLVIPYTRVKWLSFNEFILIAKDYFEQQFSPLFWIKFKNGELKKVFLVWW